MTSVRMERARAFRIPNWYLDHMMLLTGACLVPSCHLHMTTDGSSGAQQSALKLLGSPQAQTCRNIWRSRGEREQQG